MYKEINGTLGNSSKKLEDMQSLSIWGVPVRGAVVNESE